MFFLLRILYISIMENPKRSFIIENLSQILLSCQGGVSLYFHFHFILFFFFKNFCFALFQIITSKPQSERSLKLFTANFSHNSDLKNPTKTHPILTNLYMLPSRCQPQNLHSFVSAAGNYRSFTQKSETHLIHFNFRPNQ